MFRTLLADNKKGILISVPLSLIILWFIKIDLLPEYTGGDKVGNIFSSFNPDQILDAITLLAIFVLVAVFLIKIKSIRKAYFAPSVVIGLLFAVMMTVGKAYRYNASLSLLFSNSIQMIKSVMRTAGFFLLFFIIISLIFQLVEIKAPSLFGKNCEDRFASFIQEHSIKLYLIILALTVLIYLIFMPGFVMGDTASQIYESFGVNAYYFPGKFPYVYADSALTNMHPLVSTLYIYGCMKLGMVIFGSYNAGLYIAVIIQFAFSELVIVRSCYVLAKLELKGRYILAYLIYIYINVVMVNYLFVLTKDILFTAFVFLFIIELFLLITGRARYTDYVLLSASALGATAFRGEGLWCVLMSMLITALYLLVKKSSIRKITFSGAIFFSMILIHLVWTNAVLPALHVSPGVKTIQLTIPMQQVGRYVSSGKTLTEEEYTAINTVLEVESIGEYYDPEDGDSLKKVFKHDCSDEEMNAFLKTWMALCVKDPGNAFCAWLNNKYEYFYLEDTYMHPYGLAWSQRMMSDVNNRIMSNTETDMGLQYPQSDLMTNIRVKAENAAYVYKDLPMINILMLPAFYVLLLLIVTVLMFIKKSGCGKVLLIVPWFIFLTTNMLSAVNASYGRYLYPIMLMLPFIFFAGIRVFKDRQ